MRYFAFALSLALIGARAPGQQAWLAVAHDDPHGLVVPGQAVRIRSVLTWTIAAELYEIRGSVRASPDRGGAAFPQFPYSVGPWPDRVVNPGSPVAGSVFGVQLRQGTSSLVPFQGTPLSPWSLGLFPGGLTVVEYEWTAPTALGTVRFDWEPDPASGDAVLIYYQQPHFRSTPTMFVGTSLTVVPGPGGVALLAFVGGVLAWSRRR